jgi:hypothetical protein
MRKPELALTPIPAQCLQSNRLCAKVVHEFGDCFRLESGGRAPLISKRILHSAH